MARIRQTARRNTGGQQGMLPQIADWVTFSNGLTYLSCSGSGYSSNSAQFTMPATGAIDWTGNFSESNQEGSGGVTVN